MRNRARILSLTLLLILAAMLVAPLALGEPNDSPVITVTPRVDTAAIGEAVTFDYEITGVEDVEGIYIEPWLEVVKDSFQSLEPIRPTALSGTFELTAPFGISLSAYISVQLPTGQWFEGQSAKVALTGWTPPDVQITVEPRVDTAAIGEPVTFDYAITGVDDVKAIYIGPWLEVSPGAYQSLEAIHTTELSGTIKLTAPFGISLSAYISVQLPTGQWFEGQSAEVALYAADGKISVLPEDLRHIRAEAFADSDVQIVICPDHLRSIGSRAFARSALMRITIPETVTDIADDAFEGCGDALTIVAPAGSYAAEYAEAHGISLSR